MKILIPIVLLLAVVLITWYFIRKTKKKRHNSSNKKKEIISNLNHLEQELLFLSSNEFYNADEAKVIEEEIDELISSVISGEMDVVKIEKEIEKAKEKTHHFTKSITNKVAHKNDLIIRTRLEVDNLKKYLKNRSFYPKDMLFDANKLQGRALDLETMPIQDLTFSLNDLENELQTFQKNMKTFYKLYAQLTHLVEKENALTGNQKQELFFFLQNGNFDETEKLLQVHLLKSTQPISEREH